MRSRIAWTRNPWIRSILLLGYLALVFSISSRSNLSTPIEYAHVDKIAHAVEYAILGWLLAGVLESRRRRRGRFLYVIVIGVACFIGCLDEWNQTRVPGRDTSFYDLMADMAGATGGVFLWRLTQHGERRKEEG